MFVCAHAHVFVRMNVCHERLQKQAVGVRSSESGTAVVPDLAVLISFPIKCLVGEFLR